MSGDEPRFPGSSDPEIVREWGGFAADDMRDARYLARRGSFRNAAFLAQQCAEKAIKGALVFHGIELVRTHEIADLLDMLAAVEPELAESLRGRGASHLTAFAVVPRYPPVGAITKQVAGDAIAVAKHAYRTVSAHLAARGVIWPERRRFLRW